MSYDQKDQSAKVEKVGIETYINNFSDWFSENTNGSCQIK
jgi:hypothetical protein